MNTLLFLLVVLGAAPALAQPDAPRYPVQPGERVRVHLAPGRAPSGAVGAHFVGSVRSVDADSLVVSLAGPSGRARSAFSWREVARVDRSVQNRTGEALGLLIGGVVGGLVGYAGGAALSDDPLARVALIPGAFGGLLVGGYVGAHVGDRWHEVAPAKPALGFRATVRIR